MRKKAMQALFVALLVFGSTSSWGYDQDLAASYQKLFEPVGGAKAGKALHLIKPDAFVEGLKKGKQVVAIDVRTPAESAISSIVLPGSMRIPANEVFKPENLARLPEDKQIVLVCKSGARAVAVGTSLRHVGFNNVYILKGGLKALNAYVDPRTANSPPKPDKAGSK